MNWLGDLMELSTCVSAAKWTTKSNLPSAALSMTPDAKYVTIATADNGIIQFINNSTDIANLLNNDIDFQDL